MEGSLLFTFKCFVLRLCTDFVPTGDRHIPYVFFYRNNVVVRAQLRPVFWVSAISTSRFRDTYRKIAEKLEIVSGDNDRETDVLQLVKDALEKKDAGEWLMIVDNAEKLSILRLDAEKLAGKTLRVGRLTDAESKQLLFDTTGDKDLVNADEHDGAELLDELEHLPLAIAQAAYYMKSKDWSVARYLELFRGDLRLEMLRHEVPVLGGEECTLEADPVEKRSKFTVLRTFIPTFRQIWEQDSKAADMLSLMACYGCENIPYELIYDTSLWKTTDVPWLMACHDWNYIPYDLRHDTDRISRFPDPPNRKIPGPVAVSIRTLTAFSFIAATDDDRSYTMNRLVKQPLLLWLESQGQRTEWADRALCKLFFEYPKKYFINKAKCSRLTPHIMPVLKLYPQTKIPAFYCISIAGYMTKYDEELDWYYLKADCVLFACTVLCGCAEYTLNEGQYDLAKSFALLAYTMLDHRPLPEGNSLPYSKTQLFGHTAPHERFKAYVLFVLAQIALAIGQCFTASYMASSAENGYRRVIEYWSNDLNIGKYESFEKMKYNIADPFEGVEHVILEKQLRLVEIKNQRVVAEIEMGKYSGADFEARPIIHWAQKQNISLPFSVAISIALLQINRRKYSEAERALRAILIRATLEIGPKSPEVLQTKTYLATIQYALRNWDAAQALNEQVLEAQRAMYTETHPRVFENKNLTALILHGQRKFSDAEECLDTLFVLSKTKFGLQNPTTLVIANNLGMVLYSLGKLEAAKEYCEIADQGSAELAWNEPMYVRTIVTRDNLYKIFYREAKTGYKWVKDLEEPSAMDPLWKNWIMLRDAAPWIAKKYTAETFQRLLELRIWYQTLQRQSVILTARSSSTASKKNMWKQSTNLLKPWKMLDAVFDTDSGCPSIPSNAGITRVKPDPAVVTVEALEPLGMNGVSILSQQAETEMGTSYERNQYI
ncbi:hypothetical protein MMC11_006883 [Xylographa trunciseda]|nr:hypothetical protein [Xylographa trunciseda]